MDNHIPKKKRGRTRDCTSALLCASLCTGREVVHDVHELSSAEKEVVQEKDCNLSYAQMKKVSEQLTDDESAHQLLTKLWQNEQKALCHGAFAEVLESQGHHHLQFLVHHF